MITHEQTFDITITGENGITAVDWYSGTSIRKLIAVNLASAQFSMTLYNRAFAFAAAKALVGIRASGSNTLLIFAVPHGLAVGDTLTAASAGDYNGTHVVTAVINAYEVVTNDTFEGNVDGGTGNLAVPTAQRPLYKVLGTEQSTAGGLLELFDKNHPFINRDPAAGFGANKLYISATIAGAYRVTLCGTTDVH